MQFIKSANFTHVFQAITTLHDLTSPAKALLRFAGDQKIFLFYGDMGAGKTTFIKTICSELAVTDRVSSPTFSIVNEYESPAGPVYHFDFYRLKRESEAMDLGFEDYLYSGNYCLIEWPEKVSGLLPQEYVEITLAHVSDQERKLTGRILP
ncbi:tRNA (adenosine(37)-N6)-threonylcarbamoyltransferase complex ATPase subunit type 1 TsaE [Hufsiella ginkgonis]|uniref:tRNA threonylcarbamoyladenosine biosynthesis protein TsaE n=1 Tax=Hufsiella ginkgonis TaxID=2695274 RepID=A0A7K1XWK2_9SPHI|nr:tRNA (adenosine(37)-N6)-threonylcarbamoyltransferase complex ATPase subunit type 1 TsaE [Hufsiella ginkgonis]MXV14896.1 tRNA (adenosine(37)-N6)-threonylcarbamoyltransferase complex ATPase subunit type 1 TsaE [Hufsiella ginkgonis]